MERQLLQRAQLLCWRARCAVDPLFRPAASESTPVEMALALLTETAGIENPYTGARREALRVLALLGRWDEVDIGLSRFPPRTDPFASALLMGDLASRARVCWDYQRRMLITANEALIFPRLVASPGMLALCEAEHQYQAASTLAEIQNQRLETKWYGNTVQKRFIVLFGR